MNQQYVNQAFASISNCSSDELKELLNDDEKIEERINNVLTLLESEKDAILGENRSLAENNLEKEPKLIELRARVCEMAEEGQNLCKSIQEKLTQIKENSGSVSKDTALALLQTSAAESEEESEMYLKQLLDGETTFDVFLDQFMTSRRIMHTRKLKAEKMSDLLKPSPRQSVYPTSTFYPSPSHVPGQQTYMNTPPYPAGPMMPMPGMYRPF